MAEGMTARAVFDANAAPFQRGANQARQALRGVEQDGVRVAAGLRTAMAFSRGFGLVMAVRQAREAWAGMTAEMEDHARRVSRGAGGGAEAQTIRAQAAGARMEAADPLRTLGIGARWAGALLGAGVAGLLGNEDAANALADQMLRLEQKMKDAANATSSYADDLDRLATNMEKADGQLTTRLIQAASQATALGLTEEAERVGQAIAAHNVEQMREVLRVVTRAVTEHQAIRRYFEEGG